MAEPNPRLTKPPSKVAMAFRESFNALPLATLAGASLALLNPLPLLAGVVLEAAYLLIVPDSKWYEARLSARYDADVTRRREALKAQICMNLRPSLNARFDRLEKTRNEMNDQSQDGKKWFREVLRKMDYLLEKFLIFAGKEQQFRDYLRSVLRECSNVSAPPPPKISTKSGVPDYVQGEPPLDPADVWVKAIVDRVQKFYDDELKSVEATLERDPDDLTTNAVLDKRIDVLHRRREYVEQIGKILSNLNHQLQLMEDTFGLINDEIRARSPEQVLADIDDVVWKADALTELLEDVEPANPVPV